MSLCYLLFLPNELIGHIIFFLSEKDLCHFSQTCIELHTKAWGLRQHLNLKPYRSLSEVDLTRLQQNCPRLNDLSLPHHVTDDFLANSLSQNTQLRSLNLETCRITNQGLKYLSSFSWLENLKLGSCKRITDAGLSHLASLTKLHSLDLTGSNITDNGLQKVAELSVIQALILKGCDQITDEGLKYLSGKLAASLVHLDLRQCGHSITDDGLKHIPLLTKLQSLNLWGLSGISDQGLEHISQLPHLKSLYVWGCQVTDTGVEHLMGLSQLEFLSLIGCAKVTDVGLEHLSHLLKLKTLEMRAWSKLTDKGLQYLSLLNNLQYLDLRGCDLAHRREQLEAMLQQVKRLDLATCQEMAYRHRKPLAISAACILIFVLLIALILVAFFFFYFY